MKKTLILIFLLPVCLSQFANAQVLTVKGTIKDDGGNTVPLALVQDKSDKTATRADSLGRFTLKINPNSSLLISSAGFKPKLIDVNGKTDLTVILNAQAAESEDASQSAAPTTPSSFSTYGSNNGYSNGLLYNVSSSSGTLFPVFHPTEETRGSRYLFGDWVAGFVVSPQDSVFKNTAYGFNYDKISGELLLTQDKHQAISVDKDKIKSFTLYDAVNRPEVFEYAPDIDKTHFVQLIAGGKKYKIYKLTKTKFIKNNYHSDGMTSTGNNYDEFEDNSNYYVLNESDKKFEAITLKKKSIKAAFAKEPSKIDTFFSNYSGSIDEEYLKNLSEYMNQ